MRVLIAFTLLLSGCGLAMPTLPALPTLPPPTPTVAPRGPCRSADLDARFRGWSDTGGSLVGVIGFGNGSAAPCTVQGVARLRFLDRRGQAILTSDSGPVASAAHPLVRMEAGLRAVAPAPRPLSSGQATLLFQWLNWCRPSPELRSIGVLLPAERAEIVVAVEAETTPRCEASSAPSRLVAGPFQAVVP